MAKRLKSPIKRKVIVSNSKLKPKFKTPKKNSFLKTLFLAPIAKGRQPYKDPNMASERKTTKEAIAHSIRVKKSKRKKEQPKVKVGVIAFFKYWASLKADQKLTKEFRESIEKKSFLKWVLSFRLNKFKLRLIKFQNSFKDWSRHSRRLLRTKVVRNRFIALAANSTILYIISYLFIYVLNQFTSVVVGSHFGLYCKLFYYNILWPAPSSKLWSFDSVITTFISGPIFSLFLGSLLIILFFLIHEKNRMFRTFFLWGYLHAFNFFLSSFIAGAISDSGMGYALNWLYFSTVDKIIASILGTFILAFIGLASTNNFFKTAPLNFFLSKQNRILFITFIVIIPWLIGSFIILLFKIPHNTPYETLLFVPLIFAFIPIFPNFNSKQSSRAKILNETKKIAVSWRLLVLLIIVVLTYRIGLGYGIMFDF